MTDKKPTSIDDVKQAILDAMVSTALNKEFIKDYAEAYHAITVAALTTQDAGMVENIGRKLAEHEVILRELVKKLGLK